MTHDARARSKNRSVGRKALTIVELSVAMIIALVLLVALLELMSSAARVLAGVEAHLDALHAAQAQMERIENDLHQLLVRSREDLALFSGTSLDTERRSRITFHVTTVGPGARGPVYVGRPVEYRAVPTGAGSFHLARNGRANAHLHLKRISFDLYRRGGMGGSPIYFVRTTVVGLDPAGRREFHLAGLVAIDALSAWSPHQSYNPNPEEDSPSIGFVEALAPEGGG